jgi:signal-transduction protein with cAMP-binding, CBS, and nucleotidyltransferase domain
MTDYIKLLKEILPEHLKTEENFATLMANSRLRKLRKKEVLVYNGSLNRNVFLILKGSFIRLLIKPCGEEKTVMFHTENFYNFMICTDSFYHNKETTYELIANENSIIMELSYDFVQESKETNFVALQFYTSYLDKLFANIELFHNKKSALKAENFLVWFHESYPDIFNRFSGKDIANFIGITPVWLSNLKRKLRR